MPRKKFKPASASVQQLAPSKTECDLTALAPLLTSLASSLSIDAPLSFTRQPDIRKFFNTIKLSNIQASEDIADCLSSLVCFSLHPSLFFTKKEINALLKQLVYTLRPRIQDGKIKISSLLHKQLHIKQLQAPGMAYVITRSIDLELLLKPEIDEEAEEEAKTPASILLLPFGELLASFIKAISKLDCTQDTAPPMIKTLIESLHAALLLLSKLPQVSGLFPAQFQNIYQYSLTVLQKENIHKDVLTQIAILFWKTSALTLKMPHFQLLQTLLEENNQQSLGEIGLTSSTLSAEKKITLIKGFVLTYPLSCQDFLNSSVFSILLQNLKSHDKIAVLLSFQALVTLLQALRAHFKNKKLSSKSRQILLTEVFGNVMTGIMSEVRGIAHCAEDAMEMLCLALEEGVDLLAQLVEYPFGTKNFFTGLYALLKSETISVNQIIQSRSTIIAEVYAILADTKNATTRTVNQFIKLFMDLTRKHFANEEWVTLWMSYNTETIQEPEEVFLTKLLPIMINLNRSSALPFISKIHASLNQDNIVSFIELLCIARKQNLLQFTEEGVSIQSLPLELSQDAFLKHIITHNEEEARISSMKLLVSQIKYTEVVTPVEYALAERFLIFSIKSSDQKYRQQVLKHFHTFLIRVRASCFCQENIENEAVKSAGEKFLNFVYSRCKEMIKECISFEVLYSHLQILKYTIQLFGETQVIIKFLSNDLSSPLRLTTKYNWFTTELLCTLVRLQKNSWQKIRALAQFILTLFPDSILEEKSMIEGYITAANELMLSARCMVSEGAANMFLLLYRKKLGPNLLILLNKELIHTEGEQQKEKESSRTELQTSFINTIIQKIEVSLQGFEKSLIRGSKENLIHGYLSLLRLIFEGEGLIIQEKSEVKGLFGKLIDTLLNVSAQLSKMLSNLGLESEGDDSELKVDCRGHPVVDEEWNENNQDFDNFVVVGIWLALKEAGQALQSIINWIDLPATDKEEQIIPTELIVRLAYTLKQQLFGLKHRGAIAKAQESFAKLCSKLIISVNSTLAKLPQKLLQESLNEIKTTDVSKILRRSAGIPPLVLSILKAEPNNKTPKLLNMTLTFLFEEYENAKVNDFKVHTLNIMKAIFQDSSLRHDVNQFVSRALRIDIQGFASPNWGIRNSCLMSFTSIARRIFGSNRIQEASVFLQLQSVKKVKGMTTNQFFYKFSDLQPFLLHTLEKGEESSKYLAMLLLSRLHPSARIKHSQQENKSTMNQGIANKFVSLLQSSFQSDDIFVRETGARAILPFIPQNDCISYAISYLSKISNSKLNQRVAYLNLINLLVQWGGSIASQDDLLSLYGKIENLLTLKLPPQGSIKTSVYPQMQNIVQIQISILKHLESHPKLASGLQNQLIAVVSDPENQGSSSPGYASYIKAVLSYLKKTSPQSLITLLESLLSSQYQTILTSKYQEFETLIELLIKLLKESKPQGVEKLGSLIVERISQSGAQYSLIEKMLKLLERILRSKPVVLDVIKLKYLLKSDSPSIQKRIIKTLSLAYKGSVQQNLQFFQILSTYSYSDQEDEVRIACVKAWRNLRQKVKVKEGLSFDFLISVLFLLVDENPAIRTLMAYYGSMILFESSQSKQVLSLQNEEVLLEQVLTLLITHFSEESKGLLIKDSLYQEHLTKNFGDKIFFFEPLNRYVDIEYLKKRIHRKLESKSEQSDISKTKVMDNNVVENNNWKEEFGTVDFN